MRIYCWGFFIVTPCRSLPALLDAAIHSTSKKALEGTITINVFADASNFQSDICYFIHAFSAKGDVEKSQKDPHTRRLD